METVLEKNLQMVCADISYVSDGVQMKDLDRMPPPIDGAGNIFQDWFGNTMLADQFGDSVAIVLLLPKEQLNIHLGNLTEKRF